MTHGKPAGTGRVALLREIAARPFARAVSATYALLGLAGVVRELFLPEPLQAKFNFYRFWRLDWPWYIWTVLALLAAVAIVFEGAYAAVRGREASAAESLSSVERPKVTITGNRTFVVDNVGIAAAYHLTASIALPNSDLRLELRPIPRVMAGSSAEARFIGHGWGDPTLLDANTIRAFLSRAFLGDIGNWTVNNYRLIEVHFDVTYMDFDGAFVFQTPHVLRFGADHATTDIQAAIERSDQPEKAPVRASRSRSAWPYSPADRSCRPP